MKDFFPEGLGHKHGCALYTGVHCTLQNMVLLGHKKEENFTLWDSMDGPGEYYTKWNKLVTGRQIPYNLIYMWNLMNKKP